MSIRHFRINSEMSDGVPLKRPEFLKLVYLNCRNQAITAHCGSYVQIGVEPEDGRKAHHWRMRARAQPSLSEFSESYTVCCTLSHLSQVKLSIINHLSAYAKDTRVFGFVGLPYVRDGRVCRSQKQIRDKPELSSTTVMMLTSAAPLETVQAGAN
jgi:hypothetical protein